MARDFPRSKRVAQQVQRELMELIRKEVKDPRIGLISLTDVEMSKDLGFADVYVSAFGEDGEAGVARDVLNEASGYLRHLLGKEMRLRTIPQLRFHADTSIADGMRMSKLIDNAVSSDAHLDEVTDEPAGDLLSESEPDTDADKSA